MLAAGHARDRHRPLDTAALTARAQPSEADAARDVYGQLVRPHTHTHRDYAHSVEHDDDHPTFAQLIARVEAWEKWRDPPPWWWMLPRFAWDATRRLRRYERV